MRCLDPRGIGLLFLLAFFFSFCLFVSDLMGDIYLEEAHLGISIRKAIQKYAAPVEIMGSGPGR